MAEATKEEEEEEAVKVPGSIPRAAYEQTALLLLRPLAVRSRSRGVGGYLPSSTLTYREHEQVAINYC